MASVIRKSPWFNVRRSEPVFVPPKSPTPREVKRLSGLDNQESIQFMVPCIMFFRPSPHMAGKDPAKVIKEAVAKALVFYYPLAGRVREWPNSTPKLVVECTGEGAVFIEADADITLSQLGDRLNPPFSYINDIMYEVPGMNGVFNCPIIHVQVTRFKCGGFICGIRFNNIMMDGTGYAKFLIALGELARGASQPSVPPVWDRDRLFARRPPKETCYHPEFEEYVDPVMLQDKAYRLFYFTPKEIATLRSMVPHHLQKSSSFELLTGFLWRCRTIGLQLKPEEEVRMIFAVNTRDRYEPPLPKGFYGNAFAFAGILTTSGEICKNHFGHAVELVLNAKKNVTEEYMRSFTDGLALRGWPRIPMTISSFFVSDLRKMGYIDVDFGWGTPISSGPGFGWYEPYSQEETYFIMYKDGESRSVTMVPMCLPPTVMELFEKEIYSTLKVSGIDPFNNQTFSNRVTRSNL